jgi:hypothetical protein
MIGIETIGECERDSETPRSEKDRFEGLEKDFRPQIPSHFQHYSGNLPVTHS